MPRQRAGALSGRACGRGSGAVLCAGITTYNSLRHSGARPGDPVAILGSGGLRHLADRAKKLGFRTVAIARGGDKEALARKLGAGRTTSIVRRMTPRRNWSSWAAYGSSSPP